MRIATHPEAIKHLVKIGMASAISEHIKMVESANESLIEENARLKAEVERLRFIGDEIIMDVYRSECLTDKWCKMARKWDAAKEGKQP
jgi:regulator of replication initiation timing